MRIALSFSIILLLGGCAVGPNYKTPENNVPDTWSSATAASNVLSDDTPVTQWWEVFDDPLLNKYIEKAAESNYDLLTAEANILQARAMRQIAASSFFPQIGADVNATKTYFSKNGPIFAIGPSTGSLPGTVSQSSGLPFSVQIPQIQSLYNALFDCTWEIDLFGKTRRTVEAADARIGSAIEQRNDTLITVLAEVARNYIEIRSNQKLSQLLEENIAILEQKSAIVQKQLESGLVSDLDYENIQATLSSERALLPDTNAQIYRAIYTLSILTGEFPEALVEELLPMQPLPQAPEKVAVGLRSDLLRRRPDVRQRERELAAATATIGVAVASFFPTITLYGDGGFQSLMLKNLFTGGSKTWAFGGDIMMPVFQGGKLVGNLKATQAATAAAAYTYQQTILTALDETESALVAYAEDLQATNDLQNTVVHNQNLVGLSEERYQTGLVSLLNLLDSERQLNETEQTLLQRETRSLLDLITLYKALGGGWEPVEEEPVIALEESD